jgi:predicted NAD/FAD-dependent oxidoreductase
MEPLAIASARTTGDSTVAALDRRALLKAALAASSGLVPGGCQQTQRSFNGELLSPSLGPGHQIRDGYRPQPDPANWEEIDIAIVGGGIAGLSAAWRLQKAGSKRFQLLELEPVSGGTSRAGETSFCRHPWGAHYVPVPGADNAPLWQLFDEMGVVKHDAGVREIMEGVLCREPQERVFAGGHWTEGLYPRAVATEEDLAQQLSFQKQVAKWIDWRDRDGRRAFSIPAALASDDPEVLALDRITMSEWMEAQGWDSEPLFWLVDYCCRDDFGLSIDQASAWAGLFYFCARRESSAQEAPPVLTWPEGNGRIVQFLADAARPQLRPNRAVTAVTDRQDHVEVISFDTRTKVAHGLRARRVVLATPQFLAPYLITDCPAERRTDVSTFQYGAWIVANIQLTDRPAESSYPLSWDNVFHNSRSLGYVVATHQSGIDHGPTVLTWYLSLCDDLPADARRRLMQLSWDHWAELIVGDLQQGHPHIQPLISRIDVMRWGHAMIQPRPGFVSSVARKRAAVPLDRIHFAGTDLSGVALMEEAFYHGIRATEEALLAEDNSVPRFYEAIPHRGQG